MTTRECGYLTIGLLLGTAVGAMATLLTAPHSGKHTRRAIRRAGEQLQDQITETGEEIVDRGREVLDRGKDFVEKKAREAKKTVSAISG
jgi:gas vesicle protein